MAVNANTLETYDQSLLRESLDEQYSMLSPMDTPFQTAIGRRDVSSKHHEWPIVELNSPDSTNRVIEGEDAPATDAPNTGLRLGNYAQISDKVVSVSHTSEASDSAAEDINRLSEQVALKLKELKRDMEVMLLSNVPAVAGSSGTARQTAGLPAFIRTNTDFEAGGADPTLSGTTEGYPNAAATPGTTPVALTETRFDDMITDVWESGGEASVVMVNANNKRVISSTFSGNSTRYKDVVDKRIVSAIDFYDTDFGEVTIVPNRFQPTLAAGNYYVLFLDPNYVDIGWLETTRQKPLAETGHSRKRLIWNEYMLIVDNEAALGIIRDTTGNS